MSIKITRAIKAYDGFKGQQTLSEVLAQVPDELIQALTGKQIGQVMSAIDKAYHNGRASTGAEMIDNNCVWVNSIDRMIEWEEVGAEFEWQSEPYMSGTRHFAVKVKNGELIPKFCI